jgi:hypothetical protein
MAMTPAVRRLRTVLEFVNTPMRGASSIGRTARSLEKFLTATPQGQPGKDTGGVWFGSPDLETGSMPTPGAGELELLQQKVRRLLDAVVGRRVQRVDQSVDPPQTTITNLSVLSSTDLLMLELRPPRVVPVVADGSVTLKVIDGTFSDRFLLAVLLLLAYAGAGSVRACQVCGRVFLKDGKRLHCGRTKCKAQSTSLTYQRWKNSEKGQRYLKEHVYEPNNWTPGWEKKEGK